MRICCEPNYTILDISNGPFGAYEKKGRENYLKRKF